MSLQLVINLVILLYLKEQARWSCLIGVHYTSYIEKKAKPQNLRLVFNPYNLTEYQTQHLKSKAQQKGGLEEWETLKSSIFTKIELAWQTEWKNLYAMRKEAKCRDVPKEFTAKIKQFFPNQKDTFNLSYQIICSFIWDSLGDIAKSEDDTTFMDSFFEEHPQLIDAYANIQLRDDENKIAFILKEQKQHAFARFCQLTQNYETFIRHARMIETMAEEFEEGSSEVIRKTLNKLLKHSHYETLTKQEMEELQKKRDQASQDKLAKSKLITVKSNHHKQDIMGYERRGYFKPADKDNAIKAVNVAMQLFGTKDEVQNLQHAHTFPFPAMFNWKHEKIREFLDELGTPIPEEFRPPERFIASKFFKIVQNGIAPQDLDLAFKSELEKIKSETEDKNKFIYCALDFLKQYHFRIFCETELVPDFINSELDQLSEWVITPDNNYKRSIADGLRARIKVLQIVSQESVANSLKPYHEQTEVKIKTRIAEWKRKDTVYHLVHLIGALQVQQAQILGKLLVSSNKANFAVSAALKK